MATAYYVRWPGRRDWERCDPGDIGVFRLLLNRHQVNPKYEGMALAGPEECPKCRHPCGSNPGGCPLCNSLARQTKAEGSA